MSGEKSVTSFLNVDLDIRGNARDVADFLNKASVVVLSNTGQEASMELADEFYSLEETLLGIIEFVRTLQPELRSIWDRLEFRIRKLNVGIQAAHEPHAAECGISAQAREMIAALQFEIIFTVYAPVKDMG